LGDAGYDTPIALQGHGMQRALILSLLQLLAQQPPLEPDGDEPRPVPDLIVAIEEPELYLHPAQCRYLARLLGELSASDDRPATQILYATHSPYFACMDRFEQIRAVRRYPRAEGDIPCCNVQRLSFEQLRDDIGRVADIDPEEITRDSFVARCASVMDVVANEGLFASAAVVVEGYGDLGCLRAIEQQLALRWDERGIVIVPARSKNNIDRPVHVFRGLGIPCYFMFDADSSLAGKDGEVDAVRSNRLLLRLAGTAEQDFPPTTVEAEWAVLQDKLEVELRRPFDETGDWDRVVQELQDDLGFASGGQMLKNPDGAAALVRRAYAEGRSFPILEQIAQQVSELVGHE
jgi:predicted ATP-dependent endonuclease of OLD family